MPGTSPLPADVLLQAWERGCGLSPTGRALTLLQAAEPHCTHAELAAMPIGARDAALLRLRARLFGDEVAALAHCPACREPLDVAFRTSDVTLGAPGQDEHRLYLPDASMEIVYRLPSSEDVLAVARHDDGACALLHRCVSSMRIKDRDAGLDALSPDAVAALSAAIGEADPQARIDLALHCPACGHGWNALFDIASFLWTEVAALAQRLMRDVHTLARAYGWREADILAMSAQRRQCYLDLALS